MILDHSNINIKTVYASVFIILFAGFWGESVRAQSENELTLQWLAGHPPQHDTGVSWGVPWPRGEVEQNTQFQLSTESGVQLPVQSWPMAYWPDGSVKWVGLATVADSTVKGPLTLASSEKPAEYNEQVRVQKQRGTILVDTGPLKAYLSIQGSGVIDSLIADDQLVAQNGHLVAISQEGPGNDIINPPTREKYVSQVDSVAIEQDGPVRAVIRLDGKHKSVSGPRSWLPFTVRLYFYAGKKPVRMVHSFVYDGDQEHDFIKGLAVEFDVPFREEVHNRHVRFTGKDEGLWAEPVKPLESRRRIAYEDKDVYPEQEKGQRVPNLKEFDRQVQSLITDLADWNDYKLVQSSPDGFTMKKRTGPEGAWISAGAGTRASGLTFVGDVSGGLGVGVKNFWQTYPSTLEINNATKDIAQLKVWLWSPEGEAMDMRHYDTEAHGLQASYEDVQPGFSIAHGVARTHELTLFPQSSVASHKEFVDQARISQEPPLLTASPEYLHSVNVFGPWSLPDRSTPGKRWIEDKLNQAIAFYKREIEQRRWYGFWDYGDIMHSYDGVRHKWRYDVGGFAWANSELVPDMWLWYSYLRTGREDIFRMAEAMTRHTGEVDVYHLGKFEDLGSRHNVIHWGDGAKEARISQAALRRFYYYLTTDEGTGDLMHAVTDTEEAIARIDPMRIAMPADEYPSNALARARFGPDWLAMAGNWMTEWERTGNTKYRDKIVNGMESLASMEYGLFSGPGVLGFYPESGRLLNDTGEADDEHTSHLAMIMGGAEVSFEMLDLIDHKGFEDVFLEYARLYSMPQDAPGRTDANRQLGDGNFKTWHARLTAYAAKELDSQMLEERAWNHLLGSPDGGWQRPNSRFETQLVDGPETLRPMLVSPWTSTNSTAQWCLNAIEVLELIGDTIPEDHPLWSE